MSVERSWHTIAGRPMMAIRVSGRLAGEASQQATALFERAVGELAAEGVPESGLVRTRLWARDADLRRVASDARLAVLAGQRRAASASFIAPELLDPGTDLVVDLVGAAGPHEKHVCEYEPRIAPPRFVRHGDLVFLSGNTDTSPGFDAQVERIAAAVAASLSLAGTQWSNITQVEAYVHRRFADAHTYAALSAHFPCPILMTGVEGYSAPEKLVEIEVTARI